MIVGELQEFTMAEIQYQVDEMLFKMNALSGLSSLPEKPPMYFTDSDTACGGGFPGGDDGLSSGGSEVSLLFWLEENIWKINDGFCSFMWFICSATHCSLEYKNYAN